jgi:hypothetical protein
MRFAMTAGGSFTETSSRTEALAAAWSGDLQPRSFLFPRLYQYPVNPDRVTHDLELGILPFPSTIGTISC